MFLVLLGFVRVYLRSLAAAADATWVFPVPFIVPCAFCALYH